MYTLPQLDYPYDSLEPFIDKETMEIHHTKHHQAYLNNLNDALSNYPNLQKTDIEELLKDTSKIPDETRTKVVNNGGGYVNHSFYWKIMSPKKSSPSEKLLAAIKSSFGDLDTLKEKLSNTALTQFGSGWGWLVVNSGKLETVGTSNQNTPLSEGKIPLLGIDVWEHAYYLNYQNRRADYIQAFWNIVNWEHISSLFEKSSK